MQCSNCKGTEFEKSVYNYYICKTCGNFYYDGGTSGRRKNPLNEYYFAAAMGVIVIIIVILILLFMTALNKKEKNESGKTGSVPRVEVKEPSAHDKL